MHYKYPVLWLTFCISMSTHMVSSAAHLARNSCQILYSSKNIKQLRSDTSQMIIVQPKGSQAKITLCQRQNRIWKPINTPFSAVIGKNGVASMGEKKEGDLKTPAGLYSIGETFGTKPSLALKMDYKYITADDKFINDVDHKQYNMWVTGPTDAKSYETMLIKPYTYGAVINYNMSPIKSGAGSAIFIHVWRLPNSPTAGCIALDKQHVLNILHWLDKKQHPYIFIPVPNKNH